MKVQLESIGIVHSPFKEKFGTPRQPGLIADAHYSVELSPPYDREDALDGIEQFSHLWLTFLFHKNIDRQWTPKVRPPRLGGNQRIGVFASRSPYRPNPIGLSVVEFAGIRKQNGKLLIDIKGADLIEGTPILDIKPYLPYTDSIAEAKAGYADTAPKASLTVQFSEQAKQEIKQAEGDYPELEKFISQVIALDPRPAYAAHDEADKQYGVKLLDFDVQWQVTGNRVTIISLNRQ